MGYFTQDYIDFFTELAFHNEKSWFDRNRKRYESSVKKPFTAFVADMITEIQKFDTSIGNIQPKDVMFRINRDIRFSKDKTPYNTWMSAGIVKGGKKAADELPGYYFRFAVDKVSIGGGAFHPSKEHLHAIREKIATKPEVLRKIVADKKFVAAWGELHGEENKVLPKEFKDAADSEPLIKKKSFMYWQEHPETEILREDLVEWLTDLFTHGYELNTFLNTES